MIPKSVKAKPFLRWAGGKKWLLKEFDKFLPAGGYNNFHEPFIGGGAVFFHLEPQKKSFISDLNDELIETYNEVKNNVDHVIKELSRFKNNKEDYYKLREKIFDNPTKRAARFIFLNQTSFNGIYRVNSLGEYNVPYGYRNNLQIDFENIRKANLALKNTKITAADFSKVIKNVNSRDLVFIDPPYTVTHNDNGFIKYNQKIFSLDDQYRLANTIKEIKDLNAYYILTNAAHKKVREIFNNGDKVFEVKRVSLIGGKNAARGNYSELIITNTI